MLYQQKGLSLIECMVALMILVMCYFFVLSPIQTWFRSRAALSVLSSQQSIIRFSQMAARKRGISVIICPLDNNNVCGHVWGKGEWVFVDIDGNRKIGNVSHILASTSFNTAQGSLYFQGFPKGVDSIKIRSINDFNSDNGTFWYCIARAKNPAWALVLSNTGKVRVVYPDKSGTITAPDGKAMLCS